MSVLPYLALTPTDREGIPNQLDCSQFQFNSVGFWCLDVRKKSENCKKKKRRGHTHSKKKTNVMSRRERVRIGGEGGTGGWKRKVAITIAKEIKDARVKKIKKSYVPASIHHIQKTKNNNFNSQIAA